MKILVLVPALLALSACVPPSTSNRPVAPVAAVIAPSSEDILWARKDGQRMSGNPVLFERGSRDKQACEAEASASGALDFPIFASCMDRAGYMQMRRSG